MVVMLVLAWLAVVAGSFLGGYVCGGQVGLIFGRKRADAEWAAWAEHGAL